MSETTTAGQSVPSNVLLANLRNALETARAHESDMRNQSNDARRRLSAASRARHEAYKRLYAATLDRRDGRLIQNPANNQADGRS